MIIIKSIKVRNLDFKPVFEAVVDEATKIADDIELEYELTQATWTHQAKFEKLIDIGQSKVEVLVGTDDEIYGYVDKGTRPHWIFPKKAKVLRFQSGYRPKSEPGMLSSSNGGAFGDTVYSHGVFHPGTKARKFSENLRKRWQKIIAKRIQDAVRRGIAATVID